MPSDAQHDSTPRGPRRFQTTQWSLVAAAGHRSSPEAAVALSSLCHAYWYPLYAYLRRNGHTRENAQDLTQGFFATLLNTGTLEVADRERGKFRSFLLAALNHFVAKQQRQARAQKRGGGHAPASLDGADFNDAERRYARELAHTATPERLFERRWALTVLETAFAALAREYGSSGRAALFAEIKPCLGGGADQAAY